MQGSRSLEVPGLHRPTTVHCGRPSCPDGSSEDDNSDNQSYILPHSTESLQDQTSTTRIYLERPDYNPSDEGLMASAERSSSTCVSIHRPGSLDGPVEPHLRGTSSSSRLTGNQEGLNGSPRQRPVPLFQHWKWEILSIATSLGLLAGILVTLGRYNHGKQPEWPYNININSLVSVLTAVIIAQLGFILAEIISQLKWSWFRHPHPLQDLEHYDTASRGILGSFFFVGRYVRQPRAYLAVAAAFIFLMSAAIGPFTQQSIKSYACQRPLHNISASVPAAVYVNSSFVVGRHGVKHRYPTWKIMVAALEGIVNSANNSKLVPFDCPTGDCDFPPFSSLAYCSSCTDVTSHVQQHHGPRYTDSNETFAWNYTLPEQECSLSFQDDSGHPRFQKKGATGGMPDHLTFCPWDQSMNHIRETGVSILSMSWVNCSLGLDGDHPDKIGCGGYPEQLSSLANTAGLVAVNCTLGLCVRDYTSRVRNGVLHETVTNSLSFRYESYEFPGFRMLKLPCIVDSNKYELSNMSQIPAIPGRNFTTVSFNGQNVTVPLECVFTADEDVAWAINEFVEYGLLRPEMTQFPETRCSMVSIGGKSICSPWYMQPLFRGGKLTAATISSDINGIADAVSNRIRAVGSNAYGNGSGAVLGTAIQTTVCVRVDWPWLLFPAALVLLTAVLFFAVLVTARRSQVAEGQPIWKSSSVVAFFHGINARSHRQGRANRDTAFHVVSTHQPESLPVSEPFLREENHEDLMNLESMQAKAKKVVVKLETAPTGQGGFVVVKDEEDEQRVDFNKHHSQRRSSKSPRDGETLPRIQPLNNGSLHGQPSTHLHVDLGVGFTPSIRSSIDRSLRQGLEEDIE